MVSVVCVTKLIPAVDVVVSQMLWSVYLPVQFDYWHFGGTVDKEAEAQGFKPLVSALRGQRRLIEGLEEVAAEYDAEEVMILTITYDHNDRRRSYELIAQEML